MKQHRLALGYHVGGIEHNGFQFSYIYVGKKTHFQFIPNNLMLIIHMTKGIKRVFSRSK